MISQKKPKDFNSHLLSNIILYDLWSGNFADKEQEKNHTGKPIAND